VLAEEEETELVAHCFATRVGNKKKRRAFKRRQTEEDVLRDFKIQLDTERLRDESASDQLFVKLKTWTRRPIWEDVSGDSKEVKYYWQSFGHWKFDERGLLWYRWLEPEGAEYWKIVIPRRLQEEVLKAIHDAPTAGHLGERRCLHTLKRIPVFWYGYRTDLRFHCKNCDMCFRCKPANKRKFKAPMQRYLAGEPLQRMAIDIAGPFHPTQRENRYIMVVMDYFTKWACLIPINTWWRRFSVR
jgi:hypothetical protein